MVAKCRLIHLTHIHAIVVALIFMTSSHTSNTLAFRLLSPFSSLKKTMSSTFISRNEDEVKFLLYDNPEEPRDYTRLDFGMDEYDFGPSSFLELGKPVKVIMHGFLGGFKTKSVQQIKDAYLSKYGSEYTIILVDWSKLSKPKFPVFDVFMYKLVVGIVPLVGRRVSDFLMQLVERKLTTPEDLHVIGFSLGAHVASYAAMIFERRTGKRIGRITGLDPARLSPLRREHAEAVVLAAHNKYKTLDSSDAEFVDVVHTGAVRLGMKEPLGHADFYVNGGVRQPECDDSVKEDVFDLISTVAESISGSCSHFKAAQYFADSIVSLLNITACACFSWSDYKGECGQVCERQAVFGERCSNHARGMYFLEI